jgi:hypothetical protein
VSDPRWPWLDGFHEAETHPQLPRTEGFKPGAMDPDDVVEVKPRTRNEGEEPR